MTHDEGLFIVTGASKGIGRATSLALAVGHGRSVLSISRDAHALGGLQEEARRSGGKLEILPADLTSPDVGSKVLAAVAGRRVLGVVNNAGVLVKRPMGSWTPDDLDEVFSANVKGPLMLIQTLRGRLEGDPPSHVVNIGSMGGFQGSVKFPGLAAYSASKAALANLSECIAEEWKDKGIRCNCLALGSVDTDMLRTAFPGYTAPVSAETMGGFIARFVLDGHQQFNGKVLPVALSTP